jgi:hypothetical protein
LRRSPRQRDRRPGSAGRVLPDDERGQNGLFFVDRSCTATTREHEVEDDTIYIETPEIKCDWPETKPPAPNETVREETDASESADDGSESGKSGKSEKSGKSQKNGKGRAQ